MRDVHCREAEYMMCMDSTLGIGVHLLNAGSMPPFLHAVHLDLSLLIYFCSRNTVMRLRAFEQSSFRFTLQVCDRAAQTSDIVIVQSMASESIEEEVDVVI